MYRISNFTDNDDIRVLNTLGPFLSLSICAI